MARRKRHGRYRADLREIAEDFEQDWRDERDASLVREIAVNNKEDSYQVVPQSDDKALRDELQIAKERIETLEALCLKRWSLAGLIMWLFGTAAIFGAVGYITRVLTE